MKVLKERNEGGRPKFLNKAAKIVVKKDRYEIGDSTMKLSNS